MSNLLIVVGMVVKKVIQGGSFSKVGPLGNSPGQGLKC